MFLGGVLGALVYMSWAGKRPLRKKRKKAPRR